MTSLSIRVLFIRWILLTTLPIGLAIGWTGETLCQDSLDEQLFKELDDELFSDLEPIHDKSSDAKNQDSGGSSDIDRQLQRELGGEDIGQPTKTNPLEDIAASMRHVRRRIQAQDLATETQQIQGRIVNDLGKLIALLQKQQQSQQQKQQQNQQKQKQQKKNQQQQGKPTPQPPNKPANQPAKDSKTQRAQSQNAETSSATRDRMMQDAWGNLPASMQQELRSARPEKFLPKYSKLTEEYFKRLAEDRKR